MKTIVLLIALAFSIGVLAQSNPPAPTQLKATAKPKADSEKNETKPDADKRGTKDFPAVIEIGKSSLIQVETTDKNEKRHDYSGGEWWLVYLTAALVAVTLVLAVFTALLWKKTGALVRETKDTSQKQLRAYVFMENTVTESIINPQTQEVVGCNIVVHWKNSGQTPARTVQVRTVTLITDQPLPDTKQFVAEGPNPEPIPFSMGPGVTNTSAAAPFPITQLNSALEGNHIYFWGWAEYDDIFFPHTPRHRTDFCVELMVTKIGQEVSVVPQAFKRNNDYYDIERK